MEVEEIQAQACGNSKFPRIGNGRIGDPKLAQHKDHLLFHHYNPDNDHDDNDDDDNNNNENENDNHAHRVGPEIKRPSNALVSVAAVDNNGGGGGGSRLRGWHHSSRIIRVSRASGGKDRHSKVWTSKGLRDRRVRLSVMTAIQFYDLQDRLGYDQPSKAVEWLINAAADAISELPSLNTAAFPDTPKQLSDEKRAATAEHGFDSADVELELDAAAGFHHHQQNQNQNQQHLSLSKSACSSTSETSKGSGLSLSRSEMKVNRTKARERARERAAKDKEMENPSTTNAMTHINTISHNASFTELLTAGFNTVNSSNHNNTSSSPTTAAASEHQNFFHKPSPATAAMAHMDYFATLGLSSSSSTSLRPHQHHHHSSSSSPFPGQIHLGNSLPMSMSMSIPQPFGISVNPGGDAEPLQAQHHFSFVPEQHLIPVAAAAAAAPSHTGNGGGGDYSLNFSIVSSGLAGFNRGTLQSNSSVQSSLLPHHLQRFSSPIDGSTNVPFFVGAAAASPLESHHHQHQFPAGFDGRLQLCYGDGSRHSDQKGKGKN